METNQTKSTNEVLTIDELALLNTEVREYFRHTGNLDDLTEDLWDLLSNALSSPDAYFTAQGNARLLHFYKMTLQLLGTLYNSSLSK